MISVNVHFYTRRMESTLIIARCSLRRKNAGTGRNKHKKTTLPRIANSYQLQGVEGLVIKKDL